MKHRKCRSVINSTKKDNHKIILFKKKYIVSVFTFYIYHIKFKNNL